MAARLNITQQEYSRIENKLEIDDDLLTRIAAVLEVPEDAIRNMDSSTFIQTVYQQNGNNGNGFYVSSNEKIVEMYERLLEEKDKVIQMQHDVIEMFKKQQQAS